MSLRYRRRLDLKTYARVSSICSITTVTRERATVFADPRIAAAVVEVLRERAVRHDVLLHAFCVMPDHVHLLVSPSRSCTVIQFLGEFKNLAQRAAWKLGVSGAFWQPSFHDRFLRDDDDEVARIVEYIENNPVRAWIVDSASDYNFSSVDVRSGDEPLTPPADKPPTYGDVER